MKLKEHEITLWGEKIILRPMTENDWNILLKWNNDPDVLFFSEGSDVTSYTLEDVQGIYRGTSRKAFCFILELDGKPLGECWLQWMNLDRILNKYPDKDCRRIDLMIGEKDVWGQGFGTDVIRTLTTFGFEEENTDMIFGLVGDYNTRSIKAFKRAGYAIDEKVKGTLGKKAQYNYDLVLTKEQYERSLGCV